MPFKTPITIEDALKSIHEHRYVLPAIQREYVWTPEQIERLFDSLMLGYPIGSFLFWKVSRAQSREFVFYDFMRDYHERDARHLQRLDLGAGEEVMAILDGQQRLTALNIGLKGSHTKRLPRMWVTSPWAYPRKRLHLELSSPASVNELGMHYAFRFLSDDEVSRDAERGLSWVPVSKVLSLSDASEVFRFVMTMGLATNEYAFPSLNRLLDVVRRDPAIAYYEEESQDIDKVLNIFIRVNSGGTQLAYSDLLLSIATSQWKETDAREAIHGLVDELNGIGQGFTISKDLVLKSGLLLSDIPSVAFRVSNFTVKNMGRIEQMWDRISRALVQSVRLFADFGFSDRTMVAYSSILPVAYYLLQRDAPDNYLTHDQYRDDRAAIRSWVTRSLVKPGIWVGPIDTLLQNLRTATREAPSESFPADAFERAMVTSGKSLAFDDAEIDALLDTTYSDKRSFALLALLYPGFNFRNAFHVDHVYPRALLSERRLRTDGLDADAITRVRELGERLPNLQLLEGSVNTAKNDTAPAEWARKHMPDEGARSTYLHRHNLTELPESGSDFDTFFSNRRERMRERLNELLR